jgi:hypothetical protein
MARKYYVVDDVTDEQVTDDAELIENYRLAANGTTRYVDVLKTTVEKIMSGKIALADAMAKGRPLLLPGGGRWPDGTTEDQKAWHLEVKVWATSPNPATGDYNIGPALTDNRTIPAKLAGAAPPWMVEAFLEANPDRPMPDPSKK